MQIRRGPRRLLMPFTITSTGQRLDKYSNVFLWLKASLIANTETLNAMIVGQKLRFHHRKTIAGKALQKRFNGNSATRALFPVGLYKSLCWRVIRHEAGQGESRHCKLWFETKKPVNRFSEGKNYNPVKHCKQNNQYIKLQMLIIQRIYFKFIAKHTHTFAALHRSGRG